MYIYMYVTVNIYVIIEKMHYQKCEGIQWLRVNVELCYVW